MLETLSVIGTLLSGVAAFFGIWVAYKVHQNQKLLSQRQLLLPLWDHMATLSLINPSQPITPDVIKVVNTLELVALCCEGGMIDEQVIRRTFKDQFMAHYQAVEACTTLPGHTCSGKALLLENKAATQFYNQLNAERLSADKMKKV